MVQTASVGFFKTSEVMEEPPEESMAETVSNAYEIKRRTDTKAAGSQVEGALRSFSVFKEHDHSKSSIIQFLNKVGSI